MKMNERPLGTSFGQKLRTFHATELKKDSIDPVIIVHTVRMLDFNLLLH